MALNRTKYLLQEMKLLKDDPDEHGYPKIGEHALTPLARMAVESMLKDAGLDYQNPDHVQAFLFMVAGHLYLDRAPGVEPSFPVSGSELLQLAHAAALRRQGKPTKWSDIVRLLSKHAKLQHLKRDAIRMQLSRTLQKARNEEIECTEPERQGLEAAVSALIALKNSK